MCPYFIYCGIGFSANCPLSLMYCYCIGLAVFLYNHYSNWVLFQRAWCTCSNQYPPTSPVLPPRYFPANLLALHIIWQPFINPLFRLLKLLCAVAFRAIGSTLVIIIQLDTFVNSFPLGTDVNSSIPHCFSVISLNWRGNQGVPKGYILWARGGRNCLRVHYSPPNGIDHPPLIAFL